MSEFQNLIEAQPKQAEPYALQEHIEQTIHLLNLAMNRIKRGKHEIPSHFFLSGLPPVHSGSGDRRVMHVV